MQQYGKDSMHRKRQEVLVKRRKKCNCRTIFTVTNRVEDDATGCLSLYET